MLPITVFTPTYNRRNKITRVYRSLLKQDNTLFDTIMNKLQDVTKSCVISGGKRGKTRRSMRKRRKTRRSSRGNKKTRKRKRKTVRKRRSK